MGSNFFPTWPVDGPPPIPPVHGLLAAAASPAAGVRIVVDTAVGPVDENSIRPDGADLAPGLVRRSDGIYLIDDAGIEEHVWVPENAGRERWIGGVEVYPYPAEVPESWEACDTGTSIKSKSFGAAVTPPSFPGVTLSLPITCTSQQVPDEAAFRARAVAAMVATESYGVARELMNGPETPGATPYLADGTAALPNGTAATRPNHGLQVLESAIARTGRLGVIHCTPMLATSLLGQGFVIRDSTGVIRTINGIVVVPDFGYVDANPPNGHAAPSATQEWAYATGPVDVRRSEIFTTPDTLAQALDRGLGATNSRSNQITYRAERYYVVDWDTALHAAVLIDRCGADCVVGS